MKQAHLDWIEKLDAALPELFMTPIFAKPKPLDIPKIQEILSSFLHKQVSLHARPLRQSSNAQEARESFAASICCLPIQLGAISFPCELVFHKGDLEHLVQESLFLEKPTKTFAQTEASLIEGYFLFLSTQILKKINEEALIWGQMLYMGDTPFKGENPVLYQDLEFITEKQTFLVRLITPISFTQELKKLFPQDKKNILEIAKTKTYPLSLIVQCGKVSLTFEQLQKIEVGDAVILDTHSYDLESKKGLFDVQIQDYTVFHAKQKDHTLKLLGYGSYANQEMPMNDFPSDDDQEDFSSDMPEFTEEEESFMSDFSPHDEKKIPQADKILVHPEQTLLPLVVEVARLEIPLDKLLELTPGNLLDLPIEPEQGVYLTLHGKRIARGDLIQVGDHLCVRVTETAKS